MLGEFSARWGHSLVPSLPSKNQFLTIPIQIYKKADINVFCLGTI